MREDEHEGRVTIAAFQRRHDDTYRCGPALQEEAPDCKLGYLAL